MDSFTILPPLGIQGSGHLIELNLRKIAFSDYAISALFPVNVNLAKLTIIPPLCGEGFWPALSSFTALTHLILGLFDERFIDMSTQAVLSLPKLRSLRLLDRDNREEVYSHRDLIYKDKMPPAVCSFSSHLTISVVFG